MDPAENISRPGFLYCLKETRRCPRPHLTATAPRPAWCIGGTLRSQFGETSEALFLTQGYVYDTAEQAEARFKGEEPGFSLRASPTRPSRCSSSAWRARRRRGRARHRHRHGGGQRRADGPAQGRRPSWRRRRCSAPAATSSRTSAALRHQRRRWSTAPTSTSGEGGAAQHQDASSWRRPTNPTLEVLDIAAVAKIAHAPARAGGRQRVRDAALAEPARARRRHRGLFGHQAHRRPGPLPRRRHPRLREIHRRQLHDLSAPDRPVAVAVQRLGAAEGPGDAAVRVAPRPRRPRRSRTRWPSMPSVSR